MPDREILVDSKIMVVAIMVVAIIAVNGRTRSNIRPICQVEFEKLVVVNPAITLRNYGVIHSAPLIWVSGYMVFPAIWLIFGWTRTKWAFLQ